MERRERERERERRYGSSRKEKTKHVGKRLLNSRCGKSVRLKRPEGVPRGRTVLNSTACTSKSTSRAAKQTTTSTWSQFSLLTVSRLVHNLQTKIHKNHENSQFRRLWNFVWRLSTCHETDSNEYLPVVCVATFEETWTAARGIGFGQFCRQNLLSWKAEFCGMSRIEQSFPKSAEFFRASTSTLLALFTIDTYQSTVYSSGIARNVTGWPASRQARIFMKIELNSIKNRLSTGPRVGRARFRLLLAGNGPRVWSKT